LSVQFEKVTGLNLLQAKKERESKNTMRKREWELGGRRGSSEKRSWELSLGEITGKKERTIGSACFTRVKGRTF